MLAPMTTWWPLDLVGLAELLDDALGERGGVHVGDGRRGYCSTTNSSPPKRATTSVWRTMRRSRSATAHSSSSPHGMAERIVDLLELVEVDEQHGAAVARARRRAARRRSGRGRRRGWAGRSAASKRARWLILASAFLRSVMSSTSTTEPPFSIGWKVKASVRPPRVSTRSSPSPRRQAVLRMRQHDARHCAATACRRGAASSSSPSVVAGAIGVGRDAEQLGQAAVGDRDAALGVEHAQAVRHVVERGVEPAREQRDVSDATRPSGWSSCRPAEMRCSPRKNSEIRMPNAA